MEPANDPNDRRRIDAEAQRPRDAEVARMRRAHVPFRTIAERLGVSVGCVQKSVRRSQKLADALATGSPGDVLAACDDELTAEDLAAAEDVQKLNELEVRRLRFFAPDSPQRRALAGWVERHLQPPKPPVTFPVRDRDGRSWRERCDAAMSDSGTNATDEDW